jgi:hypothetical protein
MYIRRFLPLLLILILGVNTTSAKERVLDPRLHHLRVGAEREWSDFPLKPDGPNLVVRFQAEGNAGEGALRLRQQDVRQTWKVLLNGKEIGRLSNDENDTILYMPIPAGRLAAGENALAIEQVGKASDDIRVGEITLDDRPVEQVLVESSAEIEVAQAGIPIPCRITVVNPDGALMTVGAKSGNTLAVRPGVIYTSTGKARFGLPSGDYTIYAGRGFAYGIDSVRVRLRPGDFVRKSLTIRKEVPTEGYVSSDTHIHTLTHSGHGDCTIEERMITLAGEEIDLPIATDHNKHIDFHAMAVKLGVRNYFTPVVGNEVTTALGHFNIFPVRADDPIPDFKLKDWKSISENIRKQTRPKVIILNHPRDLHSGFRPFGPERFVALSGERLDGWELPANAMEVVNSGAQQTDVMRLFHDWCGLLNRGIIVTPVGASDSHDVSRFFVGQARTYIRCKDDRPGAIDVAQVVDNFLQGRVMVSCGLLAEIAVNDRFGPGDLVPASDEVKVKVRVLGPDWVKADKVELYANGRKIREARIVPKDGRPGVKWQGAWVLPRFRHDVHLVAVASGPGVTQLYWPIAKPYQPTSPKVDRRVIGVSGAVWIDADADGRRTSACAYAHKLMTTHGAMKVIAALGDYDEAVAVQVASLFKARGITPDADAIHKAGDHVERRFQAFADAWRDSEIAREKTRLKMW